MSPLTSPGRRDFRTITATGVTSETLAIPPGYDSITGVLTATATDALTARAVVAIEVTVSADPEAADAVWATVRNAELLPGAITVSVPGESATLGPYNFSPSLTGVRLSCDHAAASGVLTLALQES